MKTPKRNYVEVAKTFATEKPIDLYKFNRFLYREFAKAMIFNSSESGFDDIDETMDMIDTMLCADTDSNVAKAVLTKLGIEYKE